MKTVRKGKSWCGYKVDPVSYKHTQGPPDAVYEFIKPVFEQLSNRTLLSKCLHGTTQNNNECLNKLIWDRCSKEYFVERDVVEAVCSAVGHFNNGKIAVVKLFGALGIPAGRFTTQACIATDGVRVKKSIEKSCDRSKKRRKVMRAIKKGFQDDLNAQEGQTYERGGF